MTLLACYKTTLYLVSGGVPGVNKVISPNRLVYWTMILSSRWLRTSFPLRCFVPRCVVRFVQLFVGWSKKAKIENLKKRLHTCQYMHIYRYHHSTCSLSLSKTPVEFVECGACRSCKSRLLAECRQMPQLLEATHRLYCSSLSICCILICKSNERPWKMCGSAESCT